ncbi:MAG: Na(+)-translocating NADH-quinone reductase subunit A [Prolixibacteraceae bacterium]|nr:Na(+)-translocating NADH-quinone reductase subunit A [Prolixibacteraceae bacterium]
MSETIRLRKGLDIKLKGRADKITDSLKTPDFVAIKPLDFRGTTPKLKVKPGDKIKAGDALFFDKYNPDVLFTSPAGGVVSAVKRGERRRILEVVVEIDKNAGEVEFVKADPNMLSPEEVKSQLLKSGIWPFIKSRPFGITASVNDKPKAVYISAFDTAPLAPDYDYILEGQTDTFQTGIDALKKLTEGPVYLGVRKNTVFQEIKNVELRYFSGPHPAGNAGVQIHHVCPVSKGEVVWTVNVQDVLFIGRLFQTGKIDFTRVIALTGSEVKKPQYLKTVVGAPISLITDGNLKKVGYHQRIISGNVLTGEKVGMQDYLGFFDSQVTVIPEGDDYELLGWVTPGLKKFSASRTFFSNLFPEKEYEMNANLHGGERAFVLTGQYEKVVPMDILPVYLLKAILANDIDKMEQLGIYEVIEEDFALCEYVCTSKIKVQDILRSGINTIIKELG